MAIVNEAHYLRPAVPVSAVRLMLIRDSEQADRVMAAGLFPT